MATTISDEHIDEEISKYLGWVSDLRSRKNSLLPICRLPPETLANIFVHAARDYYHEGRASISFRVPHHWVNVSYVCRHWRDVALTCPMLWTYHFNVSPRWQEELLARSKNASLKIRIHHEYGRAMSWWSRLVENMLNHAERIEELRLNIPRNLLPTEFSLNAPRLQILDIHLQDCSSQRTFKVNDGDTLPLRALKLDECPLPWHSLFNLSGVTTLSLRRLPSASQQNIPDFLTTLGRMQALEVLHVERALPSAHGFLSSGAFDISPKPTLRCLARLFVHAPLSTTVALLSRMVIPSKTQVRLEIEPEFDSSIDDYAQLSSLFTQRFSQFEDLSSSIPAIRSLTIRFAYNSDFTFSVLERPDCDPALSMLYPPEDCSAPLLICVTMERSMASRNRAHIVGDICCSIPSTHVQTLHVINPPSSPKFWNKILGHLDGLRHMKLSDGDMPDLLLLADEIEESPREGSPSDTNLPPGHMFVPGLEKLELYHIMFAPDDWSDEVIVSEGCLRDALSTRETLQLDMTECDVRVDGDEEDEEEEGYFDSGCECGLCALQYAL